MNNNRMLTIASLLSTVLLMLHVTDDIVRGISKADFSNIYAVFFLVIMLCGTLLLGEGRLGHVIMLLTGLIAAAMPFMHMRGARYPEHAASPGGFFFVVTLFALGVTGVFTFILSVGGLWSLRRGRPAKS